MPAQSALPEGVEIVSFSKSAEGDPGTMYFSGNPAVINGEGYLNFRFYLDAKDEYYLIRYKIMDNGLLQILHVDERNIKELITKKVVDKAYKGSILRAQPPGSQERISLDWSLVPQQVGPGK